MDLKNKVFAYVTYGNKLLVFDHPQHPEAGTQVPAGTQREDEEPEDAVVREATEETGLKGLRVAEFLGEVDHPVPERAQLHRRRFYHLTFEGTPPERWRHYEQHPSDGTVQPILFELYWVRLPDRVPELAPGHGAMLEALLKGMKADTGPGVPTDT